MREREAKKIYELYSWVLEFLNLLVLGMVRMREDRTSMRLILFSKISTK